MAFVRYQKVRNRVLGAFAAVGATVGAIFGFQSMSSSGSTDNEAGRTASSSWQETDPTPRARATPQSTTAPAAKATPYKTTRRPSPGTTVTLQSESPLPPDIATKLSSEMDGKLNEQIQTQQSNQSQPTKTQRYATAMKFATSGSRGSAKAKDVLGSSNPWKLNLYDDDQDGQWERAKLDTNRDGFDDESWTFKNGYWEKENGLLAWTGDRWVERSRLGNSGGNAAERKLSRYRTAMKIATSRANSSGKGKDVLGRTNPWKLNLYDDNRDGQWDRAKLDMNRDEVDDEKWNFKKGRWEKDGGKLIWANANWIRADSIVKSAAPSSRIELYRAAFKIANGRADSSGKGKDVLGSRSPWKLNLYDENRDGQWDRAKLDTNRDEVDDEKWTFKNSRWEKDGGSKVWAGDRWESVKAISSAIKKSSNPQSNRYRLAMKIASGKANRSGKGKDVLGSSSPWKLNLYDDDRNGTWDRAKLDKNRDEVDDEKWNFKNGRWEKDGGASIWDGGKWIKAR